MAGASFALKNPPKLTLYRGFPARRCFGWSPFVNKLEARLRFGGARYELEVGNPRAAPRGKIPYIAIGDGGGDSDNGNGNGNDGQPPVLMLGDSALITRDLVDNGYLADLNAHLTPAQKAHDLALRALLEDKLYFYQLREKWQDHYYTMREGVLGNIPYPVRLLVGSLAFRANMRTLHGQGTLRYTNEEVAEFRLEVWEALNALLAESYSKATPSATPTTTTTKRTTTTTTTTTTTPPPRGNPPFWILGTPDPTEADPALFGFISSCLVCPACLESQKDIRSFPVLMEYAKRIHRHYFSDYELWEE